MRLPGTCSAATSFCAASQERAVVVDVQDEALAAALLNIPRVFDARNSSVSDVVKAFPLQRGASWSCSVAVLQHPAKLPFLCDLAVFARAVIARTALLHTTLHAAAEQRPLQVMWWDDSERLLSPLSQQVASWLHGCGQRPVVLGWGRQRSESSRRLPRARHSNPCQ